MEYCISCEDGLLIEAEKFGPMCKKCFQKTKRKDPLLMGALAGRLVVLVPALCPHEEDCKFFQMPPRHWNIIVFDKNLEPVKIMGPYPTKVAKKKADLLRKRKFRRK